MEGTVDSIEQSASGKSYWMVIDGDRYNATKPEFYATINPGDRVNFEYSTNEFKGRTFNRIEKLYKVGNGAQQLAQGPQAPTLAPTQPQPYALSLRTLSMDEPTLRCYSNIMGSLIQSGKVNLDNLLLAAAKVKDSMEVVAGTKSTHPKPTSIDVELDDKIPF